eukprot:TRINITY_DN22596_c0_g5_i1.p1 TRINITY_DN22596_c0_g5~~TRINITY_DN22596_c0_g5_i1.p1  ORF type:complete len:1371 (+),score=71.49 TRINITY_DN22596_c0_g5_i1:62-4114(+)
MAASMRMRMYGLLGLLLCVAVAGNNGGATTGAEQPFSYSFRRIAGCRSTNGPVYVEPEFALYNRSVQIRLHSHSLYYDLGEFGDNNSYVATWHVDSHNDKRKRLQCSILTKSDAQCVVKFDVLGEWHVALYKWSGELLGMDMVHVFRFPHLEQHTPTSIPKAGGALMTFRFRNSLSINSAFMKVKLPDGALSGATEVHFGSNSFIATGRSPRLPLNTQSNVTGSILLSFDGGINYDPIGHNVTIDLADPMPVAFLYVGSVKDASWNSQHNIARLALENQFYGQIKTIHIEHVSDLGPNKCTFCKDMEAWDSSRDAWKDEPSFFRGTHETSELIRYLVEERHVKIVFATSYWFQWDVYHMASRYPSVYFVHVSGHLTRSNMVQVFPKMYQARYLSGIALGWYLVKRNLTRRVGYVAAFPLGETVRAINAFKLGLEQADKSIEVYVRWVRTWGDERRERLATSQLIEFYGVEGIAHHTDSSQPAVVAQEYNKASVGYNVDRSLTLGDSYLTAPIAVWTHQYARLVQGVLDGRPVQGADYWNGLEHNSWRLAELSTWVPDEARSMIFDMLNKFEHGEESIFCSSGLRDNQGSAIEDFAEVTHGTNCLSENALRTSCRSYAGEQCTEHWLLDGVYDSCAAYPSQPHGIFSPSTRAKGDCYLGMLEVPDQCPQGHYLDTAGCRRSDEGFIAVDERMVACPIGSAAPGFGLSECQLCPAGKVSRSLNSTQCVQCGQGTYVEEAGQSYCRECMPGHFSDVFGSSSCLRCPGGTFQAQAGATGCTRCDAFWSASGMTTKYLGSTSSEDCECLKEFDCIDKDYDVVVPLTILSIIGGVHLSIFLRSVITSAITFVFGRLRDLVQKEGTEELSPHVERYLENWRGIGLLRLMHVWLNLLFILVLLAAVLITSGVYFGEPQDPTVKAALLAGAYSINLIVYIVLCRCETSTLPKRSSTLRRILCGRHRLNAVHGFLMLQVTLGHVALPCGTIYVHSIMNLIRVIVGCINLNHFSHSVFWNLLFTGSVIYSDMDRCKSEPSHVWIEVGDLLTILGLSHVVGRMAKAVARSSVESRAATNLQAASRAVLNAKCDVVIQLDAEYRIVCSGKKLAALLLYDNNVHPFTGRSINEFLQTDRDRQLLGAHLTDASPKPDDPSLAEAVVVGMRDRMGNSIQVDIFRAQYTDLDGNSAYLIGLCEKSELDRANAGALIEFPPNDAAKPAKPKAKCELRGTPPQVEHSALSDVSSSQSSVVAAPVDELTGYMTTNSLVMDIGILELLLSWQIPPSQNQGCCSMHNALRYMIQAATKLLARPCDNAQHESREGRQCVRCGIIDDELDMRRRGCQHCRELQILRTSEPLLTL